MFGAEGMAMDIGTFETLDGDLLDLTGCSDVERAYVERVWQAYRAGAGWHEVSRLVDGPECPMLGPTGGVITREVYHSPAWRTIRHIEDWAGLRDGSLRSEPGFDPDADPFADEWIGTTAAAAQKGVTLSGLLGAVQRGDVIARPRRAGGLWREVSRRSLERWQPSEGRQRAGKARAGLH